MALIEDHLDLDLVFMSVQQGFRDGEGSKRISLDVNGGFGLSDCRHNCLSAAAIRRKTDFNGSRFGCIQSGHRNRGVFERGAEFRCEVDPQCKRTQDDGAECEGFVAHAAGLV